MNTGNLIKELRLKKGLTQEELAQKTELSTRTIQRIENGDVDPRAYTLQMIAKALDVEFSTFIDSTEDSKEKKEQGNHNLLAIFHLSGLLPLFIPTLLLWKFKKDKTKDVHIHFRAVIFLQISIIIISLIGYLIYLKMNQIMPIFGGLIAGGLLSIMNTVRVMNGDSFISPFIKNINEKELNS